MANNQPSTLRRTLLELAIGLVLGLVVACLAGPRMISFWYEPPSKDAFSCAGSVEKALHDFILLEAIVAAVGAIGLVLLLWFFRRLWRKPPRRPTPPTSGTHPVP